MGVRLYVECQHRELDAVETATEDDFMFLRDFVHMALEDGNFASRFPILLKTFFSDWHSENIPGLERELKQIHAAFRKLPPEPPDGNWRAKLRQSGRTPKTLAEAYVDRDGAPLLERLIALAQTAREKGLPIQWGGELVSQATASNPEPQSRGLARASVTGKLDEVGSQLLLDDRLLAAAEVGDLALARAALADGASPNAIAIVRDEQSCSSSTPALYTACTRGDIAVVELLLSKGADPDGVFSRRGIVDFETRTCLIASLPHFDIASMLLKAGANPNLPSTWGEDRTTETSPLAHATGYPHLQELLRSHGAH